MNKETKQLLLVGGSILVVSVAYYIIKKGRGVEQDVLDDTLQDAVDSTSVNPVGGVTKPKTTPSGTPLLKAPKELDTPQKVQSFQTWMDAQGKPWINVNGKWHFLKEGNPNVGGKGLGNFGPATAQVWKIFGKQYLESLKKWNAAV
jgi:hypothetical protein